MAFLVSMMSLLFLAAGLASLLFGYDLAGTDRGTALAISGAVSLSAAALLLALAFVVSRLTRMARALEDLQLQVVPLPMPEPAGEAPPRERAPSAIAPPAAPQWQPEPAVAGVAAGAGLAAVASALSDLSPPAKENATAAADKEAATVPASEPPGPIVAGSVPEPAPAPAMIAETEPLPAPAQEYLPEPEPEPEPAGLPEAIPAPMPTLPPLVAAVPEPPPSILDRLRAEPSWRLPATPSPPPPLADEPAGDAPDDLFVTPAAPPAIEAPVLDMPVVAAPVAELTAAEAPALSRLPFDTADEEVFAAPAPEMSDEYEADLPLLEPQPAPAPAWDSQPESPPQTALAEAAPTPAAPTPAAPHEPEPPSRADDPSLKVIGSYSVGTSHYTMYADGSVEAQTESGIYRFSTLDELREFIEKSSTSTV